MCREIKISVIIPFYQGTYNSLKKTLLSATEQTYKNIECIVIDDGSKIPFAKVNENFKDDRVKWINLNKNCGVAHVRNKGIQASSGNYIAFLDTGDWWHPSKIENQLSILEKTRRKWIYSSCMKHTLKNDKFINFIKPPSVAFPAILSKNFITGSASSVMAERNLILKTGGFDEDPNIVEDWDMWIRMSKLQEPAFAPFPLVNIRIFDLSSRSQQIEKKISRIDGIIQKHWKMIQKFGLANQLEAYKLYMEGHLYFLNKNPIHGMKSWIRIYQVSPLLLPGKKILFGILSLIIPTLYYKLTIVANKFKNKINFFRLNKIK